MKPTPHVAAIHDLSGYGRCALTEALPVLSAMGVHCTVLPTAYLSAHTAFADFTFLDLTEEMKRTMVHWQKLGLRFDAVYSGFIGSHEQIDIVLDFAGQFHQEGKLLIVDPVMGDDGKRYATYTDEMVEAMRRLTKRADVITPNLTEAAFLLNRCYEEMPDGREGYAALVRELSDDGRCSVALTGVCMDAVTIGTVIYDRQTDQVGFVMTDRIPGEYLGGGDLFASVLTGALVQGKDLNSAAILATRFVRDCAEYTHKLGSDYLDGIDFEPLLYTIAADKLQK